jgi:hypothetical protein
MWNGELVPRHVVWYATSKVKLIVAGRQAQARTRLIIGAGRADADTANQ